MVGEGKSAGSPTGTSTFYIDGVKVGTADRVVCGTAFERVYRLLWKESGVRETPQPLVKDLLSDADPTDLRKSDFEIRGCALGRGLPVVCDMGSALHSDGTPYAGASTSTAPRLTA